MNKVVSEYKRITVDGHQPATNEKRYKRHIEKRILKRNKLLLYVHVKRKRKKVKLEKATITMVGFWQEGLFSLSLQFSYFFLSFYTFFFMYMYDWCLCKWLGVDGNMVVKKDVCWHKQWIYMKVCNIFYFLAHSNGNFSSYSFFKCKVFLHGNMS